MESGVWSVGCWVWSVACGKYIQCSIPPSKGFLCCRSYYHWHSILIHTAIWGHGESGDLDLPCIQSVSTPYTTIHHLYPLLIDDFSHYYYSLLILLMMCSNIIYRRLDLSIIISPSIYYTCGHGHGHAHSHAHICLHLHLQYGCPASHQSSACVVIFIVFLVNVNANANDM